MDSRVSLGEMSPGCCGPRGTIRHSILAHYRGIPASVCRAVRRNIRRVTGRVATGVRRHRHRKGFYIVKTKANTSLQPLCTRLIHGRGSRKLDFHGMMVFGLCRCCPLTSRKTKDDFSRLGSLFLDRVSVSGRGMFAVSKAVPRRTIVRCYHLCRRHVRAFNNVSVMLVNVNHRNGVTVGRPKSDLDSPAQLVLVSSASHTRTTRGLKISGLPPYSVAVNITAVVTTHGVCLLT